MLVGLRVQVRPAGETAEVRATVPVNPFAGATVIVEVAVAPASELTLVGLAVTVKSFTVTVTVAECVIDPLVPVTVTVYTPAEPVQDRAEVCDAPSTILVGVRVQVKPAGDTVEVKATVPVKPFTGATVIVDVAAVPTFTLTLVGLAVTVKSMTVTVTVAEWDSAPLVPVTVTVYTPATPVQDRAEV